MSQIYIQHIPLIGPSRQIDCSRFYLSNRRSPECKNIASDTSPLTQVILISACKNRGFSSVILYMLFYRYHFSECQHQAARVMILLPL